MLGFALYGSIFVLPIFLQSLHGLTANQTGLVILPGAIASAVTMAFVGRNANRLDARTTVAIGARALLRVDVDAVADDARRAVPRKLSGR